MVARVSAVIARGLFLLALLAPAAGAQTTLPEPVTQALKREGVTPKGVSVYAHEIGQPKPLLAVAADTPRNPASTIKLLTTLAALEELGPAYRWKTEVYATGPVRDGRLEGDLDVKGYGDPFLVIEHFWRLLRALRLQGIESIGGDLVLDQSHFAREPGDPAEFDGRPERAYNVLPSALLVNFQAVNFRFLPDMAVGRVRVVAEPQPANLVIENQLRLTNEPCRGWNRHVSYRLTRDNGMEKATFSGRYDAGCGANELFRVVNESTRYVHGVFTALWRELGGRFDGGVREAPVPANARLLYAQESPPLADVVRSVNKYSNNVMARQLLLTLAAEKHGAPGTGEKGAEAVRAWLKRRGLEFPELVLDNGAGLSREGRISARHLGEVLLAGYSSPYMPEFLSSLPIAAVDGTLRDRLGALEGQAHLKTGLLNNVRGLAGVMRNRQGRRVAVVILHNHSQADGPAGRAVQEAVLEWVYNRL
jgi:D-alanyl-D-alanine carboxypeptidase/D-alanyl-D-alanine-endopeptidase (penicillin-binding protein 4)